MGIDLVDCGEWFEFGIDDDSCNSVSFLICECFL